jgi:hypothetical protein
MPRLKAVGFKKNCMENHRLNTVEPGCLNPSDSFDVEEPLDLKSRIVQSNAGWQFRAEWTS